LTLPRRSPIQIGPTVSRAGCKPDAGIKRESGADPRFDHGLAAAATSHPKPELPPQL
jgi:hypothetical protein